MQVVLNKDVKKLGYRGDLVKVKSGYFRNFLSPEGLAAMATPALLKLHQVRKEKMVMQKEELLAKAREAISKLKGLTVTIKAKVSDKGKLYGAITEKDVIDAVEAATKIKLEKDFLKMEHFKAVGEYSAVIHLGEGLEEKITVVIKGKKE